VPHSITTPRPRRALLAAAFLIDATRILSDALLTAPTVDRVGDLICKITAIIDFGRHNVESALKDALARAYLKLT
jgi:hypothetical protein